MSACVNMSVSDSVYRASSLYNATLIQKLESALPLIVSCCDVGRCMKQTCLSAFLIMLYSF